MCAGFAMELTKGFYDFCVPYSSETRQMVSIMNELVGLGYGTVAIEQTYDHTSRDTSKKQSDLFPAPADMDFTKEIKGKLKVVQRLTIIYSDAAVSHAMTNSTNLKKYHLIAGLPKTESALTHCCTSFSGDIICMDPENNRLLINRKMYQVAVKRGMYFELKYVPAIINSSLRKDMIKIAHNYHAKGKSKNIIFSSGATTEFELRGPYDVANLALIFGLTEEQGKSAVSSICRSLYLKAESRRLGKTIMFVKNLGPTVISSSEESQDESEDEKEDSDFEKISENSNNDDFRGQPFKKKKLG